MTEEDTTTILVKTLNEKFGINNKGHYVDDQHHHHHHHHHQTVTFDKGEGGLVRASMKLQKGTAAQVYLHGAHVVSFKNEADKEILFLSKKAIFNTSKAIRGGIPVIFPQFGGGALPQHGFVRDKEWEVVETGSKADADQVWITLELKDSEATRKIWPYPFTIRLTTTLTYDDINKSSLHQKLNVKNDSESEKFEFTSALHTYFAVGNIHSTVVSPLQDLTYFDKPTGQKKRHDDKKLTFHAETDRIFYDSPNKLFIEDDNTTILLVKENFNDAVVWNIWEEKIKTVSDMSPEEWEHYVCVEAGAIGNPIVLEPKKSWEAYQVIGLVSKL